MQFLSVCSGIEAASVAFNNTGQGWWDEAVTAATVRKGDDAGGGGARESTVVALPIAFSSKDHGADASVGVSPTLRAGGHSESHANAGVMPAVAFQPGNAARGAGSDPSSEVFPTLKADHGRGLSDQFPHVAQAVAFDLRGREEGAVPEGPHDTANIRASSGGSSRSYLATPWAVRRLTPRECERLQGFPDDYTLVPYRGKPAADGPRYKALGNSMAVNAMEWIGERIAFVDGLLKEVAGNAGNQVDP